MEKMTFEGTSLSKDQCEMLEKIYCRFKDIADKQNSPDGGFQIWRQEGEYIDSPLFPIEYLGLFREQSVADKVAKMIYKASGIDHFASEDKYYPD
jgi:hypothetical protein